MAVEIRQTIVTPTEGGSVVQMHISAGSLGDESQPFQLVLTANVGRLSTPLMAELERAAMRQARDELSALIQALESALGLIDVRGRS